MFRLSFQTPVEWVARVESDPLALLSDHAHCEMKAAASAQALIGKNPGRHELVVELCALASEELGHFASVMQVLHERGGELGPLLPNPYAQQLLAGTSDQRDEALLERLLVSALIEMRSCERFHLLATHLRDRELGRFYAGLTASEARHQALFQDLARRCFPRGRVDERMRALVALEGRIVAALPFDVRVHSGLRA